MEHRRKGVAGVYPDLYLLLFLFSCVVGVFLVLLSGLVHW